MARQRLSSRARHPFVEQVWAHRMRADADGIVPVAVVNDRLGFGVLLETQRAQLPGYLQWQCFQSGLYAMGIEPCTNHPRGQGFARERGELVELAHGEHRDYVLRLSVLDGAAAIAEAAARVRRAGAQPETDYPHPSGAWERLADQAP